MIAVDTNLLVYAHRSDSPWFDRATDVVRRFAEGSTRWALPWPCVHEFFAIVTHPRIYDPPTPRAKALAQLDAWLQSPSLLMIGEDTGYFDHLRGLVTRGKIHGSRVHDARIAAICLSNGVTELWTADRDFSRFSDLVCRNPLTNA